MKNCCFESQLVSSIVGSIDEFTVRKSELDLLIQQMVKVLKLGLRDRDTDLSWKTPPAVAITSPATETRLVVNRHGSFLSS